MDKTERSDVKAFDYQSQLPSLPLPCLNETCEKYLCSVKPLVSEEEYLHTKELTDHFQNNVGKELHDRLVKISSNSRNWVADMWYGGYMDYRGPLPAISNTAGGVQPLAVDQPELGSGYHRASLWIHALVQMFLRCLRQEIPVQKLGKTYPMDMMQFLDFFCAGRIPGERRDTLMHYVDYLPKKDGTMEITCNIKHIIVLMHGRIFKLPVFDNDSNPLLPPIIERLLLKIEEECKLADSEGPSIGSLTAADRNTLYKAYQHLCLLDRQNKANFNVINSAIFAFAFDDVETFELQDSLEHAMLGECKNRWFDKNLTGITGKTGLVGTSTDHIHYDGLVGTHILKYVRDELLAMDYRWKGEYMPQDVADPIELQFTIDDDILETIKETQTKHKELMSSLDVIDKPIPGFGKAFSKASHINPDTLVQMALQLAYYRLHKRCVSTYESATTRLYYHGRTETVRSCTCESKEWVEAMCNSSSNFARNEKLFWRAVKNHNWLMSQATNGKGIDRHLFALKTIAKNEGLPIPDLFLDKSWRVSGGDGNFIISSSLSGFHPLHGSIAPMVFDGYGAFYTIDDRWVYISVCTWKGSTETKPKEYHANIVQALGDIKDLLMAESSNL